MALDREAIFVKLANRLAAVPGLAMPVGRKLPSQDQPPAAQPAIFLDAGAETPDQAVGRPAKWTVEATIAVYVRTCDDPSIAPSTVLNNILKDVETALEWQPGDGPGGPKAPTTLGGLCSHCWISGTVEKHEGITNGGQGGLIIPIEIVATAA